MPTVLTGLLIMITCAAFSQNKDPLKTEIVTSDITNFWIAFDATKPEFKPEVFQELYLDKGSKGLRGFMNGRIKSADNLARIVRSNQNYYESARSNTESIAGMKDQIIAGLVKLKELYPPAVFPPVYFVMGALNSGGTTSVAGLLVGAEMFGRTPDMPEEKLNPWLRTVIKPIDAVPHLVAHELVHFQQRFNGRSLLAACIREGSADFIAELVSGKHGNAHVHEFANAREKELWLEFKVKMNGNDYDGWLYSPSEGRPNDVGYWMGYQIVKSYYDNASDKKKAISDILRTRNPGKFLERSKYAAKFE